MNRTKTLSLFLALATTLALAACHPRPDVTPPEGGSERLVGVDITSQLKGTLAGGPSQEITFVGTAAHLQRGRQVIFRVKQLVAREIPGLGPLTITLDPRRESTGTLDSPTPPATHQQNFFLQIQSQKLGTLVSTAPLTLSARIESSPPTARYESVGGEVAFFKEGDPEKRTVLTVQGVTSDVKPAASQEVEIKSRVTARLNGNPVSFQATGRAVHQLNGTSVIFTSKLLRVPDLPEVGPLTITLNPRGQSIGILASERPPTEHRQSFFLLVQSDRLGTLTSDAPVIMAARIESIPARATYKLAGGPVDFYKQGDPGKKTVLTIDGVESDVAPAGY